MAENKLISIGGLQHYHEKAIEVFSPKVHTHQASEIIENTDKRFVSDAEKALWADKYTKEEVNGLINGITKLTLQKVDELPQTGEENVIYLVPSKKPDEEERNIKEEYLWINGSWELIGSTAPEEAHVFKADKTDFDTPDSEIIQNYFTTNEGVTAIPGDVFVIRTYVDEKVYEYSSYMFDTEWQAMTGNVDAEKVIMRENITLAGNYTQVGNVTKGANETKTLDVKGKSFKDVMMSIFTAKLQPGNPTQPAIGGFTLQGARAVEAGTQLSSVTLTAANLSAGSYQYGPATGVVAQSWQIDRVTNVSGLNVKIADANSATDDNGGTGFVIGDQAGGDNVVNSLKYTVTATHNEGVVAHDNLGGNSDPEKKIAAGSKNATTAAYTPFRQYFYGATSEKPTLDSAYIRSLTNSNKAYTKGNFNITVPAGSTRVAIACIATSVGVTRVINTTALNADVTETFVKSTVQVAGANNYAPIDYNVWVFEPAEAYGQQAILQVTLG